MKYQLSIVGTDPRGAGKLSDQICSFLDAEVKAVGEEQVNSRIDVICLNIARELRLTYERKEHDERDSLIFYMPSMQYQR